MFVYIKIKNLKILKEENLHKETFLMNCINIKGKHGKVE